MFFRIVVVLMGVQWRVLSVARARFEWGSRHRLYFLFGGSLVPSGTAYDPPFRRYRRVFEQMAARSEIIDDFDDTS